MGHTRKKLCTQILLVWPKLDRNGLVFSLKPGNSIDLFFSGLLFGQPLCPSNMKKRLRVCVTAPDKVPDCPCPSPPCVRPFSQKKCPVNKAGVSTAPDWLGAELQKSNQDDWKRCLWPTSRRTNGQTDKPTEKTAIVSLIIPHTQQKINSQTHALFCYYNMN